MRPPSRDEGAAQIALLAATGTLVVLCSLLVPLLLTPASACVNPAQQPGQSSDANSIPANYLELYKKAGTDYGIPWNVIAGIGKVESDHGRSTLPGVQSGENHAGAGGPMQFLAPTWASYGVDGDKDGRKDRYDPVDAIPGAANYLRDSGAPDRMRDALYAYNHSWDYVDLVLSWADKYAAGGYTITQPSGKGCPPSNIAIPNGVVGKILEFALAQRGDRYVWGGTGPDGWDCSGLVQGAYASVGLTIPRTTFDQWPYGVQIPDGTEQPGDLIFFASGPGSTATSPGHVAMVVDPQKKTMIEAWCSSCGPVDVRSYADRPRRLGFTRPLARPDLQRQLNGDQ